MWVKSQIVYEAILTAAEGEFAENGYVKATINNIARRAETSSSNVYVCFQSKLEIALAVYEPWFKNQILALEQSVSQKRTVERKLTCLLEGLWKSIPRDENRLTAMHIQALATATPRDPYSSELLRWTESKIAEILSGVFDKDEDPHNDYLAVAHMIMLTFDGVGMRQNLRQPLDRSGQMISQMVSMLARS